MKSLNEVIFGTLLLIAIMLVANVLYFSPWLFPSVQDDMYDYDGKKIVFCQ